MSTTVKNIPRRQCIPIIYTRGTHYEVGFDVVLITFLFLFFVCFYCYQLSKVILERYVCLNILRSVNIKKQRIYYIFFVF